VSSVLFCSCLTLFAASAAAQQNPWPFDFDPNIAADPAGVNQRLDELGQGVPPIPTGDLVPTAVGPMTLYFHEAMLELLELAFDSGPGTQDYFERTPSQCAQHAAFSLPDGLVSSASLGCQQTEQALAAAFDDDGSACLRVEFPELYIYDQPVGEAAVEDLKTVEGLISIAGEVFTHIDYPTGLLPASFVDDARRIIAKVRYTTLLDNLTSRRASYEGALALLQDQPSCFDAAAASTLTTTIGGLIAELDDARTGLEALHTEGLAQAATERAAVVAAGRMRTELLHPSLTDRERELLALYIGGIYWRMRGEALLNYPESGLLKRLLYTQYPYQVIADLTGGTDGADIGRDIFIHETWGYADWMDIGRWPDGNDKYSDMVDMAKRGKRTLELAAPRLEGRGYDTAYLYAGGLQMGPCYYYGWEPLWEPNRFFQLGEDLTLPYVWFLESPTAHGEFCTGGALGLGLARTLLHGKPDDGSGGTPPAGVDAGTADDGSDDDDDNGNDSSADAGAPSDPDDPPSPGVDAGPPDDATPAPDDTPGGFVFDDDGDADVDATQEAGCVCVTPVSDAPLAPWLLVAALTPLLRGRRQRRRR
jgi:hypothetical protein